MRRSWKPKKRKAAAQVPVPDCFFACFIRSGLNAEACQLTAKLRPYICISVLEPILHITVL